MDFLAVNFLAILVSAVLYMVIGFLWYGPLFSKRWMALVGMTQEQAGQGNPNPVIYLVPFVAGLIAIYVLAVLIGAAGVDTWLGGAGIGLLAAVGFVATFFGSNYLFANKPLALYLIDAGYPVLSLVISGAILGVWR